MADPANSVAVATGSPVVSGTLTSFVAAEFDLFILNGIVAAIASRDSASKITLKQPWPGESVTGATGWTIVNTGPYWQSSVTTNKQLAALLGKFEAGPVKWDASGPLSGRGAYNNQPKDFVYLSVDPAPFTLFVKLANTNSASDWSAGQPLQTKADSTAEAEAARDAAVQAAGTAQSVTGQVQTFRDQAQAAVATGRVAYDTLAQLNANLAPAAGAQGEVRADPTVANNGTYDKVGASGSGSWVKKSSATVPALDTRAAVLETLTQDADELGNFLLHVFVDRVGRTYGSVALDAHWTLLLEAAFLRGGSRITDDESLDPYGIGSVIDEAGRIVWKPDDPAYNGRGSRALLGQRLAESLDDYGLLRICEQDIHRLRQWKAGRRVLARGEPGQATWNFFGDSWTYLTAWHTGVVRNTLAARYGDAGCGYISIVQALGSATGAVSSASANSAVTATRTGSWTQTVYGVGTPDLAYLESSTPGDRITITVPATPVHNEARLFFVGTGGVVQYRWNGGAWTQLTLSGSGTASIDLAGVPSGAITLDIETVSGTVRPAGVEMRSVASGVRINKLGINGARAADFAGAPAADFQASVATLNAKSNLLLFGTNDQSAGRTPAQFAADLGTIIDRIRAATPLTDILIAVPPENLRTNNSVAMASYAAAARALARSKKCAFLDLQYAFGDVPSEYGQAGLGFLAADLIHPSTATGSRLVADAVLSLLAPSE